MRCTAEPPPRRPNYRTSRDVDVGSGTLGLYRSGACESLELGDGLSSMEWG